MPTSRHTRTQWAQNLLFALLAALLLLTVLNQSNPARKVPARDYGIYLYTGAQILQGDMPYRDAWESKPPAIFYVDVLALWLGRGTRWGVWAVEALSLLAAIALSFQLMRKLWGTWAALFGLLAWLYGLHTSLNGGNMTEEYPLPLHFLALTLFPALLREKTSRSLSLLLGVIFGLCFLFRPNNAVVEAAILLTLMLARLARRDWRGLLSQAVWFGLGAALPLGLTAVWFQSHGLLQELLEASILYNLAYSGTPLSTASPLVIGSQLLGWALWAAVAGYAFAAFRLLRGDRDPWWTALLLIGWPMTIFLSDPAKRNYPHYYMNWLPFLGLLAALAFFSLQRWLAPRLDVEKPALRLAGIGAALIATLFFFVSNGMVQDQLRMIRRLGEGAPAGGELRSDLAVHINKITEPGETVLFWGGYPGENFMSRRDTPAAPMFYPMYVRSEISSRLEARFLEELLANPPVVIVDMGDEHALSLDPPERERRRAAGLGWEFLPSNLHEVFTFIDGNYVLEGTFQGLGIYRLKGSATQTP